MEQIDDFYNNFKKEDFGINKFSILIKTKDLYYTYNYNENEIYDIASITKLFTLNIIYNLEKKNYFKYSDNINQYLNLPYLNNYTILDLIKMKGIIETKGKLSDSKNQEEFNEILKTVTLKSDKGANYTDIGFCILGILIEKLTNKTLKENFEELFHSLGLNNTKILPNENYILLGNGNNYRLPHDYKTRINNGISGAAGIFSNLRDLEKYALKIINYEIFDQKFINEIFNYNFIDIYNRNRTYAGLYKYTNKYRCYIDKKYSNKTLAHQGYTGAMMLMDFENKIINVLLFDAIENNSKVKKDNFFAGYRIIQMHTSNFSIKKI